MRRAASFLFISYISPLVDRIIMPFVNKNDEVIYVPVNQLITSKNQSKYENNSTFYIIKNCINISAIFR